MYTFTEGVLPNPHRNIKHYPILEPKVDKLVNSIEKTGEFSVYKYKGKNFKMHSGYWDNTNFFVDDPKLEVELVSAALLPIDKQLELSARLIKEGRLFRANGHHRGVAIEKLDIGIISAPIRYMDEETSLHVMILENLESFGGTTFTTLESIIQSCNFIMRGTEGTKTYAEYEKKVGENKAFSSAKQYSAAVKAGLPSIRVLEAFLGKAMPTNTIAAAVKAVQYIYSGVYTTEMIRDIPSIDALRMFNALTGRLLNTTTPLGVLGHLIEECAEFIIQYKPSGKDIVNATNRVDDGTDPLPMLKEGLPKAFQLEKYLVKLLRRDVDVRALAGMDGDEAGKALAGAEKYLADQELKQARDARRDALNKAGKTDEEIIDILVKEKLMVRPPAPPAPPTEEEIVEATKDMTPEESKEYMDKLEAGTPETSDPSDVDGVDPDTLPFDPSAEGPIDVPDRSSAKSVMNYAHSSMQITGRQLTNLIGRVEEAKNSIEADGMIDTFFPAVEKTFKILAYLMIEHVGVDGVRKVVNTSAKIPPDEAGLDVKAA